MDENFVEISHDKYYELSYKVFKGRELFSSSEITKLTNGIPNEFVEIGNHWIDCNYNGREIFIVKAEDYWFFVLLQTDGMSSYYKCTAIDGLIAFLEAIG